METTTQYEVKEISWPGKTFIAVKAKIAFDELSRFLTESYRTLYEIMEKQGEVVHEPPFAIYYSFDEAKKETELAAAVVVSKTVKEPEGFQKIIIPESKALLITYYGPYENMGPAHTILEEYIVKHKLKKQWVLEEYWSDPVTEKDPNKWKTNIYYIVD